MRMLMTVRFPNEPFNSYVIDGTIGAKMGAIMEAIKPEAAYFVASEGMRTGILVVDMQETSEIPTLAEPFFLQFDAEIEIQPTMLPADLQRSALDTLGKKWG